MLIILILSILGLVWVIQRFGLDWKKSSIIALAAVVLLCCISPYMLLYFTPTLVFVSLIIKPLKTSRILGTGITLSLGALLLLVYFELSFSDTSPKIVDSLTLWTSGVLCMAIVLYVSKLIYLRINSRRVKQADT